MPLFTIFPVAGYCQSCYNCVVLSEFYMRLHPYLYEVNTCLFMRRLSEKYRRPLTLSAVPEKEWQFFSHRGFDLVWLMGVWQRSPGSRREALLYPTLRRAYDEALSGWTDEDIAGSPYAVHAYALNPALGKSEELTQSKSRLNSLGLSLVLDFVPNHLALDHPWTLSHPEWFVQGNEADVRAHPDWFFSPKKGVYPAHGRDPNFPPWTDTVQVNFYSKEMRQALINELLQISQVADGVRCDMAMLALNEVFERVWGEVVKDYPPPATEFWAEAISLVKQQRPGFLFLAEAYWGLEKRLQELGFDFTYDKGLYERLRFSTPDEIRSYLVSGDSHLERSLHFIENHDELRTVIAFGRERSLAAAVILATIPGLSLFHDGQLEGRRIRLPVQLMRPPEEMPDPDIARFYDRLLLITKAPAFHEGEWQLLQVGQAWEGNKSHQNLLAWSWQHNQETKIVVVNYSPDPAQGRLKSSLLMANVRRLTFMDELTGTSYVREPDVVNSQGLYIDLAPYRAHILAVSLRS